MKLLIVPVTPFQQNCSLVMCTETGSAALVDPGGDIDRLLAEVARRVITAASPYTRTFTSSLRMVW